GGAQAEEQPQGGRLAGAVGAEEAHDRPGVDLEVELVDGEHVAEALGEALDADGRHGVPPWEVVTPTTLRAASFSVVGLAAALAGPPRGGGGAGRRPSGAARSTPRGSGRAGGDQARLVGEHHELGPVAGLELG